MLNNQLGSKETLSDGILAGLLRAGYSSHQQENRANTENSGFHIIPPQPCSRGQANTIRPIWAWSLESPRPAFSAVNQWEPATPPTSARQRVPSLLPFEAWCAVAQTPLQPWPPLQPAPTRANAARVYALCWSLQQQAPVLENPVTAVHPGPAAVAENPVVRGWSPVLATPRRSPCNSAGATQDPLTAPPSAPLPATDLSISDIRLSSHHFQQTFSCSMQTRPHRACRNPQHSSYVRSVHLFHEREQQDAAQLFRQLLDF